MLNNMLKQPSIWLLGLFCLSSSLGCVADEDSVDDQHNEIHVTAKNTAAMEKLFVRYGLQRPPVIEHAAVPAIYVNRIPQDLHKRSVKQYKKLYILLLLPNITAVNLEINADRQRLLNLKNHSSHSDSDKKWLLQLADRYGVKNVDLAELLLRVDQVPASLALAQSINETAWGSSRFATQGNALFGQHIAHGSNDKFIKAKGANIKVAAFDSPLQGVRAYMHNLNTTKAYRTLRQLRQDQRLNEKALDGVALATGLAGYSERGQVYVQSLQRLISSNHLQQLDDLVLLPPSVFISLPENPK